MALEREMSTPPILSRSGTIYLLVLEEHLWLWKVHSSELGGCVGAQRIRGFGDNALYKSTFYLLTYKYCHV